MRPRTKKHLEERIEKCSHLLPDNPASMKGLWGQGNPVHLEIGCGKGTFICEMAKANPDINFVAIEIIKNIIVLALEKVDSEHIDNVKFISGSAANLREYFDEGELDRIYLNFSDPWPKSGHKKRRLTHPEYLAIYKDLLSKDGAIIQKTDNRALFDFSIESYQEMGCNLDKLTYDLHSTECPGNIMTEYEQRFVSLGQPIHRVEARFN